MVFLILAYMPRPSSTAFSIEAKLSSARTMSDINRLKKTEYGNIIFSRWLTVLIPQLLLSFVYSVILHYMISGIGIPFMLLALGLNVLFSIVNFSLSLIFTRPGYANLLIGFAAYLILREDIQNYIISNRALNSLNIFECVTSFTNNAPSPSQIALPALMSAGLIIFYFVRLKEKIR